MTGPAGLFDAGLQPERTSLAWQRTALSVAAGSLVSLRVFPAALGHPVWYMPGVVGVIFAGWMWWMSRRRHLAFTAQLGSPDREPRPAGGSALLAVTCFSLFAGAVATVAILLRGL